MFFVLWRVQQNKTFFGGMRAKILAETVNNQSFKLQKVALKFQGFGHFLFIASQVRLT